MLENAIVRTAGGVTAVREAGETANSRLKAWFLRKSKAETAVNDRTGGQGPRRNLPHFSETALDCRIQSDITQIA